MKWLCALLAVMFMVAPAMAGEDPYIAIVDNDILANTFYFSPKYTQFLYDQPYISVPVCFKKGGVPEECEIFKAKTSINQPEVCDYTGTGTGGNVPPFIDRGNKNAKTPAGNSGWYDWWIRLPKKPDGEINIVIQCGVVKPNAFAVYGYDAVALCAAETGERVGVGVCVRQEVDPGVNPLITAALPKLTAIAYPGPYNDFTPFHLTAFKNPSSYTLTFDAVTSAMSNNTSSQALDGSSNARILLKTCMDKTVVTKLPVTGQLNALGEAETDLEAADMIYVRLDVPRQNTVDVYCHAQSARLAGIGEAIW